MGSDSCIRGSCESFRRLEKKKKKKEEIEERKKMKNKIEPPLLYQPAAAV